MTHISDEHRMVVEGYIARLRRESSGLEAKAEAKCLLATLLEADLDRRPSSEVERANAPVPSVVQAVTQDEIEQWERDDEQNGYEQISYAGSAPDADDTLESKPQADHLPGQVSGCKPSTCSRGCSASRMDR